MRRDLARALTPVSPPPIAPASLFTLIREGSASYDRNHSRAANSRADHSRLSYVAAPFPGGISNQRKR
jgi:hypothetical protein